VILYNLRCEKSDANLIFDEVMAIFSPLVFTNYFPFKLPLRGVLDFCPTETVLIFDRDYCLATTHLIDNGHNAVGVDVQARGADRASMRRHGTRSP
jgi:hypothetical protein